MNTNWAILLLLIALLAIALSDSSAETLDRPYILEAFEAITITFFLLAAIT